MAMKCIKYVPFFNIFYDIFFNGTPSVDAIKDSLNVQALLSALLIAIVISYPGAFDYDELKEADVGGDGIGTRWRRHLI